MTDLNIFWCYRVVKCSFVLYCIASHCIGLKRTAFLVFFILFYMLFTFYIVRNTCIDLCVRFQVRIFFSDAVVTGRTWNKLQSHIQCFISFTKICKSNVFFFSKYIYKSKKSKILSPHHYRIYPLKEIAYFRAPFPPPTHTRPFPPSYPYTPLSPLLPIHPPPPIDTQLPFFMPPPDSLASHFTCISYFP